MDADRWRQISRLYHAAGARAEEERRAFLDLACEGDEALRREVEALLADDAQAQAFLAAPAAEVFADLIASESNAVPGIAAPGLVLGGYRIERLLGRGGMGAVFLAYDTTLHRQVALKVMEETADGDTSRTRLLREARNAAALNHPNICTIHEVGGRQWLGVHRHGVCGRPLAARRTSSMRYKKRNVPIDQIGRELGVDYVLEGSARREGTRVRINATLIRARDQTQRWSDGFERELSGILALQSDVARGVAGSLALTLLPAEQSRLASTKPVNPEAYEAYLMGLSHAVKMTRPDLDAAEKYFDLALARDSGYALAYVGLSKVWSLRQQMQFLARKEAAPRLKAA